MTAAVLKQTRVIPIVFTVVSDPVGDRFVEGLARPGGSATGITNVESSLTGKWLELLKEVAPLVKRVAFIFNPKLAPGGGSYYTRLIEASAPPFAVTPTVDRFTVLPTSSVLSVNSSASQTAGWLCCRTLRPWFIAK